MGLLSFLKRSKNSGASPGTSTVDDSIEQARARARHRLIGAVVLVGAGVIGFPVLFETQPRPIPVDLPITIPRQDVAQALPMPPARSAAQQQPAVVPPLPEPEGSEIETFLPDRETSAPAQAESSPAAASRAEATATEQRPPARTDTVARPAAETVRPEPAKPVVAKPVETRPAEPPKPAPSDAQRAQALLDGRSEAASAAARPASRDAEASRFVVQVGAFTEVEAVREARQKVEQLGFKTYTQVVETSTGKRTRVRVGPFTSREEAEKVAGRLKTTGLAVALLTL